MSLLGFFPYSFMPSTYNSDFYLFPSNLHTFYFIFCLTVVARISVGFPGSSVVKNLPANAGDAGSIPGSGRSPGGGNGNPVQYSWLGNPMDRGAWWATVYGVAKSWPRPSPCVCAHVRMHTHTSICVINLATQCNNFYLKQSYIFERN